MKLISSRGRGYPWFYLEVNVIKDVEWNVDSLQHAQLGWIPRKSEVHTACFLKISGISESFSISNPSQDGIKVPGITPKEII